MPPRLLLLLLLLLASPLALAKRRNKQSGQAANRKRTCEETECADVEPDYRLNCVL